MSYEFDPFCPPPFGAAVLSWVATNYAKYSGKAGRDPSLNPVFGVFALSVIASADARSVVSTQQNLESISGEIHEWRHAGPRLLRAWNSPFWGAVDWGVAARMLTVKDARLLPGATTPSPQTEYQEEIRKKSMGLGWSLAQEENDYWRWRLIRQPRLVTK
jgi:hypothetical protein